MTEQRDSAVTAAELDAIIELANDALKSPMDYDQTGWMARTCGLVRQLVHTIAALRRELTEERAKHALTMQALDEAWDAGEKLRLALHDAQWDAAKKDAALRKIAANFDCGCVPCTGQCRSHESLQIELEEIKQTALDALGPAAKGEPDVLADLVTRFSAAILEKARAAEAKYGWNNAWRRHGWADTLRQHLREHVEKGDPRDVAIYAAFAWHHGWSLAQPRKKSKCRESFENYAPAPSAGETVLVPREPTREMCFAARRAQAEWLNREEADSPVIVYRAMLAAAPTTGEPT